LSIIGIGTDVVAVERMLRMHQAHAERLAVRLLAGAEIAEYERARVSKTGAAAFLARRFAAKEAAAKALGCGIGARAGFRDLIVEHYPNGAPRLAFSGAARDTADRLGVNQAHISITDEQTHAVAFVVLEN
jgi:holo-[acyl-carrier protein] synthase